MKEIHILGAGVSGLTAAITLLKKGKRVVIHEKRNNIGGSFSKTIHGMLNYNNIFCDDILEFMKKEIGLNLYKSYYPINTLRRYSPSGFNYITRTKKNPIIYDFIRGNSTNSLENELLFQAIELGVEVEYNSKRKEINSDIITTGAQFCDFKGYGIHYLNMNLDKSDEVKVFFNDNFTPKGYGYILPFDDNSATIAIFIPKVFATKSLIDYYIKFQNYLSENYSLNLDGKAVSEDSGIGYYNLYKSYKKGGLLYSGVRAGLMTADYGFGMKEAIISGYLAGLSIALNKDYNKLIRSYLLPEIADSIIKRWNLDRMNNDDYDSLIKNKQGKVSIKKNKYDPSKIAIISKLLIAYLLNIKRTIKYEL